MRLPGNPPAHLQPFAFVRSLGVDPSIANDRAIALREDFEHGIAEQRIDARLAPLVKAIIVGLIAGFADAEACPQGETD